MNEEKIEVVEVGAGAVAAIAQMLPDTPSTRTAVDVVEKAIRLTGCRFLGEAEATRAVLGESADLESDLARALRRNLKGVSAPAPVLPRPFPPEVREKLGVYVYVLVDPMTSRPFYIGKGRGDRVFQHVWGARSAKPVDSSEIVGEGDTAEITSKKNERIDQIFGAGFGVEHWIIRHRIDEDTAKDHGAFAAEQSMLDFAALSAIELVNIQGGHVATEHGMQPAGELALRYSAETVPALPTPCGLVKVNAAASPTATREDVYEWSRQSWIVGAAARNIPGLPILVFANDIVRAVYRADEWELVHEVVAEKSKRHTKWWRFTGEPDVSLEARYVGKSLRDIRAQRSSERWQQHGWHPYLHGTCVD